VLQGYDPNGFFDEMFATPTEVRRHYERFRNLFEQISPAEFDERRTEVDLAFMRQGVTFNVYGDSQGAERIFPFDLVPRIISAKEWEYLERGLIQRITALNLFLQAPPAPSTPSTFCEVNTVVACVWQTGVNDLTRFSSTPAPFSSR
jgi:uncharacterized circularly permuted ATP-grasp superfamily protein